MNKVLKIFIKEGADVTITNKKGMTPLMKASTYGVETVRMLLKAPNGKSVVNNGPTLYGAITSAVDNEPNEEAVKLLIEAGAKVTNQLVQEAERHVLSKLLVEDMKKTVKLQSQENSLLNKIGNFVKGKSLGADVVTKVKSIAEGIKMSLSKGRVAPGREFDEVIPNTSVRKPNSKASGKKGGRAVIPS